MLTLSNPLNLAVIGNPGRRSRGRWVASRSAPKRRRRVLIRRKGSPSSTWKGSNLMARRRNPVKALDTFVVKPVTSLPQTVPALFKGKMVRNVGFAAGGAFSGLVGGALVQKTIMGALARFMPTVAANALSNGIVQRVLGASFALVTGGVIAKYGVKNAADKQAFITGTAAAALIEAVFPGRVAGLMARIPYVGPYVAPVASPVQGLAGVFGSNELAAYVESPAYQGVGAYVESPAYQGVGAYVESPAYQGVGGVMDDAVAGLGYDPNELAGMGSNMASHLD